jgi:electron transfer flavoprotein alpha/beta subunit
MTRPLSRAGVYRTKINVPAVVSRAKKLRKRRQATLRVGAFKIKKLWKEMSKRKYFI